MKPRRFRNWRGVLGGTLSASVLVVHAWAQPDPSVQLRWAADGRLLLETSGDTNRAVLEQASALTAPLVWKPAQRTAAGAVDTDAPQRFFRLRLAPAGLLPPSAAALGDLLLQEASPSLRPGETAQFAVTSEGGAPIEAVWSVNGIPGGSTNVGLISAQGVFSAPRLATRLTVTVSAEVRAKNGDVSSARTLVEVAAQPAQEGFALLSSPAGGTVLAQGGVAQVEVTPGALPRDTLIEIFAADLAMLERLNTAQGETNLILANVTLLPEGARFDPPATVRLGLNQYFEPGTKLPLQLERVVDNRLVWEPADVEGEVEADGFTFVFRTPHFSNWRVLAPAIEGPLLPVAPVVAAVLPARLREGELKPILLRGANFSRGLRVSAHLADGVTRATALTVQQTAWDPGVPGEYGLVLKSSPDSTLAAGAARNYTLRLQPQQGPAATVTVTVEGLDEFRLLSGQVFEVPAVPAISRLTFSRIDLAAGSVLRSRARLLAWQSTDSVQIGGSVLARGNPGADGELQVGGAASLLSGSGAGGQGAMAVLGANFSPAGFPGSPALSVNFHDFLPGTLNRIFGQPGVSGFDPALLGLPYNASLDAVSEAMHALYMNELDAAWADRDPFDFDVWRELSEELTGRHPEGRKGQQGVPGGFIRTPPRIGLYVRPRRPEGGGGGGGGGASFRPAADPDGVGFLERMRIGLGGGAGGDGGGGVSLVAGATLTISPDAMIDTSGGNGGHGAAPVFEHFSNPGELGRGGAGGPGGAGTIHLLAGERLTSPGAIPQLAHSAGFWGAGGFRLTVQTHRQANPRSWLAPIVDLPDRAQAELAGPDFNGAGRGLRTGVRTGRAVEARALNPHQAVEVRVSNSRGETVVPVRGVSANARRVRFLLAPGTNQVVITSLGDHAVLNREILVLNTPDSDGDGLADDEEADLGFNPASADSDGDGLPDSAEWLAGGQAVPGDSDSDGVPDQVELSAGSDPDDPGSNPWNGPDVNHRALIVASPVVPRVIRPAVGPANGVPVFVAARPAGLRVVLPAAGGAGGVSRNVTLASPRSVRVVPQ